MKILALDTSTNICSVALMIDDKIESLSSDKPREHTNLILQMIKKIIANSEISLSNLDALAFSRGPGSFTGVRIAAGVVQGLSFAKDLPVVPISTLRALSQNAYRTFGAINLLPSLDAHMKQIYWGIYQIDNQGISQPIRDDSVCYPQNIFIPKKDSWLGIGSGWEQYEEILKKLLKNRLQDIKPHFFPSAQDIAILAKHEFKKGNYVDAENALPIYLMNVVQNKIKLHS